MPLKLKNAAMMPAPTSEFVEAVGIRLPVHPHLLTAEKLTFASFGTDTASPVFVLRAFAIFTQYRCPPEDHVTFEQLNAVDLAPDEIAAIASAVGRLFAATRENDPEESGEGKATVSKS